MKKILLLLISFLIVGCTTEKKKNISEHEQLMIITASDLHFLDPSLYENYSNFTEDIKQGDGKMVHQSDVIIQQFIHEVNQLSPDLVVLSGDLSFNGDVISHTTLSKMLDSINAQVLVIPGNHDIDNYMATGYSDDGYIDVDTIDSAKFREIYANHGYNQAISKDEASCSYRVSLNDQYEMFLIDDNGSKLTGHLFDNGGFLSEGCEKWLKEQLEDIQKQNKLPLITMHHNLAIHNETYFEGFTINNNLEIANLFKEYKVPFVYSGHMHLQNIKEVQGIYDIASSSLLVNPLQYGVTLLDSNIMEYQTRQLNLDLNSYEFYVECFKNRMGKNFTTKPSDEAFDLLAKINAHYFAGDLYTIHDEVFNDPLYQELKQQSDSQWVTYYIERMSEESNNSTHLTIAVKK